MAAPIKQRNSNQSLRNRRKPSLSRKLSRSSSQLSFALAAASAFSSQNVVIKEKEEEEEEEEKEEGEEVTMIFEIHAQVLSHRQVFAFNFKSIATQCLESYVSHI